MRVGVYKTSGGKDIVSGGSYSYEAGAQILFVLKKLCEEGVEVFKVRTINKNTTPKLHEIKHGSVRLFYFIFDEKVYITHIVGHKQKNKTETCDKDTASNRIHRMIDNEEIYVQWLN